MAENEQPQTEEEESIPMDNESTVSVSNKEIDGNGTVSPSSLNGKTNGKYNCLIYQLCTILYVLQVNYQANPNLIYSTSTSVFKL